MRIKICGVTRPEDAEAAARLGVDFVGLNFYRPSPRSVAETQARSIVSALPPATTPVALFVQEPLAYAQRQAEMLGIQTVQMHTEHRELLPPRLSRLIPAFPIKDEHSLTVVTSYLELLRASGQAPLAVLLDAHVAGLHGGTGRTAPWQLLAGFDPGVPVILAGGLTPDNVAEAVSIVQPWGVDVASGVEAAPGIKDAEKMKRFVVEARAAQRMQQE